MYFHYVNRDMINFIKVETTNENFEIPEYLKVFLKRLDSKDQTQILKYQEFIDTLLEYIDKKKGIENFVKFQIKNSLTKLSKQNYYFNMMVKVGS